MFCQLLLTFAIVLPFAFHTPLRLYVRNNSYLYWVAFVIVIVCLVSMACCEGEHYLFFQKVLNFDALKIYDKLSKIAGELYVVLIAYVHCNCYLWPWFFCIFSGVRRKFPKNIIFLGVFTAAEGFMLGCFCARFEADAILYAIGITAGVTFGLTIFAFQTKIDFTACGGMNQLNSFQMIFNP